MSRLGRMCVYCGSKPGVRGDYLAAARDLARRLHARGCGLVYGGARVGTMGAVADAMLEAGGEVIGVIPHGLVELEVAHEGLTEIVVVDTLHERKARMVELADGFVTLPGGFGSHDELFEALTWLQLGIHDKPVGLLDVAGYWGGLLVHLDRAVQEGFLSPTVRGTLLADEDPERLLDRMEAFEPPDRPPWRRGA